MASNRLKGVAVPIGLTVQRQHQSPRRNPAGRFISGGGTRPSQIGFLVVAIW